MFFLTWTYFTKKIKFHPALVILDFRYSRWISRVSDLASWVKKMCKDAGVLALYTLGDANTANPLLHAGFADIPFDHAAITACLERVEKRYVPLESLTIDWQMVDTPAFLRREHEVLEVKLTESIETIFTNIIMLLDAQKEQDVPDIKRARWILATLAHLPVPLIWYEQAARSLGRSTLRSLITKLGINGRYNSDLGAVIQTLRMLFDQLYHILSQSNSRSETLKTLLPHIVTTTSNEQVLLLVRDRVIERAVQNWLELETFSEAYWLSRIVVKACPNYHSLAAHRYDVALINGVFPHRYRWIAGASLGTHVIFLAYPYEVDIIEHQLQNFYGEYMRTERARQRDRTISQLTSRSISSTTTDDEVTLPYLQLKLPPRGPTKTELYKTSNMLKETQDITKLSEIIEWDTRANEKSQEELTMSKLAAWEEDISDEDPPEDLGDIPFDGYEEGVACICLQVHSRQFGVCELWLAIDEMVDFMRPSLPNDIQRSPPHKLQANDVLLLMNEGRRTNIFDRFVDLAEDQPKTRYLVTYRRDWRKAVQRMVARHQDQGRPNYAEMLRSLQTAGATIQSEPAVRSWVQDQVIGPDNIASIAAVGRVSGMESLVQQAKDFDRVFRDIRSIRQSIGRRLNNAIRSHFKHLTEGVPEAWEDSLDSHLKFPLEELIDTIELAEVIKAKENMENILPRYVGQLRPIN